MLNVAKATGVTAVTVVVATVTRVLLQTWYFELRTGAFWRSDGAVGLDLISFFWRDITAWLPVALIGVAVGGYCYWRMRSGHSLPLPISAATLAFLMMAAVFLCLAIPAMMRPLPAPAPSGLRWEFLFFGAFLATPAYFAALLGAAWLQARCRTLRTLPRLLFAAAGMGALFGTLFAQLMANGSRPPASSLLERAALSLIGIVPGVLCAVLLAIGYRRRFLARSTQLRSPAS